MRENSTQVLEKASGNAIWITTTTINQYCHNLLGRQAWPLLFFALQ